MKTKCILWLMLITSLFIPANVCRATDLEISQTPGDLETGKIAQSESKPRVFSRHDTDRDGFLSREEYRRFVEKFENRNRINNCAKAEYLPPLRFEKIDANDDGHINENEMIFALNKRLQKHRRYRYRGGRW